MIERIINNTDLYKTVKLKDIKIGNYFVYDNNLYINYSANFVFNLSEKRDLSIENNNYLNLSSDVFKCSEINIYFKLER